MDLYTLLYAMVLLALAVGALVYWHHHHVMRHLTKRRTPPVEPSTYRLHCAHCGSTRFKGGDLQGKGWKCAECGRGAVRLLLLPTDEPEHEGADYRDRSAAEADNEERSRGHDDTD
jgi:hypothetical protein